MWLVAGRGRRLPEPMFGVAPRPAAATPTAVERRDEAVPIELVSHVRATAVVGTPPAPCSSPSAPLAHELLARCGVQRAAAATGLGVSYRPPCPAAVTRSRCPTTRSRRTSPTRSSTSPRSARAGTRTSWRCGTRSSTASRAFWTFGKSQKILNLRRDPKMTGLVESGDDYNELSGVELVGRVGSSRTSTRCWRSARPSPSSTTAATRSASRPAVHRGPGEQAARRGVRHRARRELGPHQARRRVLTGRA